MGANQGVLLSDEAFAGSDARGIASVLKGYVQKEKFDLDPHRRTGETEARRSAECWPQCSITLCFAGELHRGH